MSWWRTNRLWLPLLPLALLAMIAASAYHVKTFWYDDGLRTAVASADPGQFVAVDIPYTDAQGRTAYRFGVRLDGFSPVEELTDPDDGPQSVPAGVSAFQVRLSFRADPDVALSYCHLEVVDSAGRQYTVGSSDEIDLCVPEGHEGPSPALFKGTERGAVEKGHQRPTSWTVKPVVLVKDGARITEARVWFDRPDYVALPHP